MMENSSQKERIWAMFCHLGSFVALLLLRIPFANIIGPLIVWLLKRNEMKLVDEEGKESLNFQISMSAYWIGVMIFGKLFNWLIRVESIYLILSVAFFALVLIATYKVSQGKKFTYPLIFRLIK